ncbi:MAG: class I SAM-dependent methyltransferase [Parcubacteria group bacterium]|nr:class I SAM-dependent methyltransferase [Parcubacteria group bacterium]
MKNVNKLNTNKVSGLCKSVWENINVHGMNLDVNLVKCQKYLFPDSAGKKLLYIGFGEGQNLIYLAKEGFDVYGTEIAENRFSEAKKRLKKHKIRADLRLVESNLLPFKDDYFDVVIGWQSLYYNNKETLTGALSEINRVLKPGGKFLSSMISPKQTLLCNKEIAPSVYHPAKETGQSNCIVFCFKTKEQINRIYKEFVNIRIGFYSSYLFRSHNFHYVIACEKPKKNKE